MGIDLIDPWIPEQLTLNQGLWILTNQLDRSAREIVTPALCIRFAVDSWVGFYENCVPFFRSISKESYRGQAAASIEGPSLDAGDAVRNIDARQAGADSPWTAIRSERSVM